MGTHTAHDRSVPREQGAGGGGAFRKPEPTPACPLRALFQVVVAGPSSAAELHNLTAGTEYLLSVHAVSEAGVGEGLRGLVTTGGGGRQSQLQSSPGRGPRPHVLGEQGESPNRSL